MIFVTNNNDRVNVYARRMFLRRHKNHLWILCHGIYTKDLGYVIFFIRLILFNWQFLYLTFNLLCLEKKHVA